MIMYTASDTVRNCARGVNRGRSRVGPRGKPDDSYFHLIDAAFRIRTGQGISDNGQLT